MNYRRLHRVLAWSLVAPLFVFLVTGAVYRVGRTLFGMDRETGDRILDIHVAAWLGATGSTLYVAIVGCGVMTLLAAGFFLLFSRGGWARVRRMHRILGAVILLPLAASAVTGVAYKVGKDWLKASDDTLDVLMDIHQGSWLGPTLRVYYVIALAGGLLLAAGSGLASKIPFRKSRTVLGKDVLS